MDAVEHSNLRRRDDLLTWSAVVYGIAVPERAYRGQRSTGRISPHERVVARGQDRRHGSRPHGVAGTPCPCLNPLQSTAAARCAYATQPPRCALPRKSEDARTARL